MVDLIKGPTLTMSYLARVDPAIVNDLQEILPMGPYSSGETVKMRTLKWEYAVVFSKWIEDANNFYSEAPPYTAVNMLKQKVDDAKGPCVYMGFFMKFIEVLSKCQVFSNRIPDSYFDDLRNALYEDVADFKEDFPSHFQDLVAWRDHEARRMLEEMGVEPVVAYDQIRTLYKRYTGGSAGIAPRHKDRMQQQMEREPFYHSVACFATLVTRISELENRLAEVEKRQK
jgi:hypothetical protein